MFTFFLLLSVNHTKTKQKLQSLAVVVILTQRSPKHLCLKNASELNIVKLKVNTYREEGIIKNNV